MVKETYFPVPIDGRTMVLCDDVLYTGRTVRAALDAPGRLRAAAGGAARRADRPPGHRELPIQADVVGETVSTHSDEVVEVHFAATDGEDSVRILARPDRAARPRVPAGDEEPG